MEDYPATSLVKSEEHCDPVTNMVQSPLEESTSICNVETRFSSTGTETGISAESSTAASGNPSIDGGSSSVETSNCRKCLTESTELVASQVSTGYSHDKSHRDSSTSASTSFKEQQSSDPVSVNLSTNEDAVSGFENANKGESEILPEPSILSPQGLEASHLHEIPVENQLDEVETVHNYGSDSAPSASEPGAFHSLGGESIREAIPSGLGLLVSSREQGQGDGSVLHVDVVSISSNILPGGSADTSNRAARRNSRRLFWDAFSRRSSRRLNDSPSIFFATDDSDDTGFHDRWLLDFSGDSFYDGIDSGSLSSRIHSLNERRRHSRLEIWERLRGGHDDNSWQTTFCPSGLHPDGRCSCDSLMVTDESSARAGISRIVMLAEALFEVLDEIHRQPESLSLSIVSIPAPESVVDSFPLRSHKKVDAAEVGDAVEQCYICLAEYDEGDKIRVLPCQHEFHMSCVDKWLKEIHSVCPLCRGDVCQDVESSVSNS
ncbi:hypothetical protein DITRI_Ditri07aG0032800 [Diplodiscus trichospermus]